MAELSLLLFLWVLVHHPFEWGHIQVELLCGVLPEVCELKSLSGSYSTCSGGQSSGKELQERGLTRTVGSHDTHTSLGGDGAVGSLLEDLHICTLIAEGDVLQIDQFDLVLRSVGLDSGERGRVGEGEHIAESDLVEGVVLDPLLVVGHAASYRSRRVRVAVASDESLPLLVLLLVVNLLALLERLEVHLVVVDLLLLDEHNGVTDVLEKLAVVGDQQEGPGVAAKAVLEPEDGREVQVVSRLVQKEKVGSLEEGADKSHAHSETSGELVDVLCLSLGVETKRLKHLRDALLGGVVLKENQLLVDPSEVFLVFLLVLLLGKLLKGSAALAQSVEKLVGVDHSLHKRSVVRRSLNLLHVEHGNVLWETLVKESPACHGLEKGRFTASVVSEKRMAFARFQDKLRLLVQLLVLVRRPEVEHLNFNLFGRLLHPFLLEPDELLLVRRERSDNRVQRGPVDLVESGIDEFKTSWIPVSHG
mmetsp:Transcript_17180/g.24048  ORF Transcript_17180/g.24048 Transcript_17180/m.24048 type:complete len:476 (+) Transcript_17180:1800-3227(+)